MYVSVLPDRYQQRSVYGLNHAAGRIYSLVRKAVVMRHVPRLTFRLDDSLKKQDEVFEAIRRGIDREAPGGCQPADDVCSHVELGQENTAT